MKTLAAVLAMLCATACATTAANSDLVGTWRLVEFWNRSGPDQPKAYRFGEHPLGYFVYDTTGHVHIQIARNPQPPNITEQQLAKLSSDELRAMIDGYVAYFGTYTVDAAKGIVVHHVEGDARREYTGTDQPRPFRLNGDELVIGDGKTWLRRLVRVKK